MLRAIREGEELDLSRLNTFFTENKLISSPCIEEILQFSNGFSNLTYLIKTKEGEFVLRKPPKGAIKRGHDMGREFKVLSSLQDGFGICPKVYAYTEDEGVLGSSFYVMSKVDGIILAPKEAAKRQLSAEAYAKVADIWLNLFVKFHELDYKAIGLESLGRPEGYVDRQVTNWGKQYYRAATREIPEADKLINWMKANQPTQYDHCLIHNDFKYDNVVFKDEGWDSIVAILDWEMCTLGDPLMDLGTSLGYWVTAHDGFAAKVIPSPTKYLGNPSRSDIVQQYALKSGRSVDHIVFYYAYGLFKIAVIVQQIFYRYNKGLTTDEKFARLDETCELLIKMGWQAVQSDKIENYM